MSFLAGRASGRLLRRMKRDGFVGFFESRGIGIQPANCRMVHVRIGMPDVGADSRFAVATRSTPCRLRTVRIDGLGSDFERRQRTNADVLRGYSNLRRLAQDRGSRRIRAVGVAGVVCVPVLPDGISKHGVDHHRHVERFPGDKFCRTQ